MKEIVESVAIKRITGESREETSDLVTRELPLTIILNNQELVTMLCSPENLNYLAVGFLASEGLIRASSEIKKMLIDSQRGIVRVETTEDKGFARELLFKRLITSGCGRGASFYSAADAGTLVKIESSLTVSARIILAMVKEFQHRSEIYRATGGVHSAALCNVSNILVFAEDIGRHNAIDKIFGQCLLEDIPTDDKLIITSGRISSEILLKVAKRSIPIIVSVSAPTDVGVRLAQELGVTLIGFVRGNRMNIYTHDFRVVSDEEK